MYFVCFALGAGGYLNSLAMDRVHRLQVLAEKSSPSLPYLSFILVGFALATLGAYVSGSKLQKAVIVIMLAIWCVLLLLEGNRRELLYAILDVLVVRQTVLGRPVRL